MVVQGTGWVGFGIGESMTNSDIIMGNVVNGQASSGDFWSFSESSPRSDSLLGCDNDILAYAGQDVVG